MADSIEISLSVLPLYEQCQFTHLHSYYDKGKCNTKQRHRYHKMRGYCMAIISKCMHHMEVIWTTKIGMSTTMPMPMPMMKVAARKRSSYKHSCLVW